MHVCPPLLPLDNPHAPHRSPECPDRSASAENRTAFAIRAGSSSSGQATAQPRLGAVQHWNPDAAAARHLNARAHTCDHFAATGQSAKPALQRAQSIPSTRTCRTLLASWLVGATCKAKLQQTSRASGGGQNRRPAPVGAMPWRCRARMGLPAALLKLPTVPWSWGAAHGL